MVHFSRRVYPCDRSDQAADEEDGSWRFKSDLFDSILTGPSAVQLRERILGDLDGLVCHFEATSCNLYGDPVQRLLGFFMEELSRSQHNCPVHLLGYIGGLAINDLCNARCTMCVLTETTPPGGPKNGMMCWILPGVHCESCKLVPQGSSALLLLHWVGEPLIHRYSVYTGRGCKTPFRLHLVTNGIA